MAEELLTVERPARYLGSEPGARPGTEPDERGFLLRVALAFPEVYEIAHSHLGHKILYHLLNHQRGFSAERVYAPWPDYERKLLSGRPLRSLESQAPLSDFHVVGFSLQYELSYTNILNMIALGGLNPRRRERPSSASLIVAGGPGAANPEPLADFVDLFFVGEAEDAWLGDFSLIKEWAAAKAPKMELYKRLAGRPGVYIPELFEPRRENGRFLGVQPLLPGYERATRATVASLAGAPFPDCQIVPWVKPVHDRVVVEIARGCARGCRFCQAGYLYRPVRERGLAEILTLAERNLLATGYDEAAFLSLSAGDHTQIEPLVTAFMGRWAASGVALSLPSLRVKSLSPTLARQIARVRKTGFTIAPEAATARLRAVINKDLTEDDLLAASHAAFSMGWRTLKLYFMAGLPTETEDDLLAMVELAQKVKKQSRAQINISVATFIPKPHTPFQWLAASSATESRSRRQFLTTLSQRPGLVPRTGSPEGSVIEALLARGDRRLGPVLEAVWRKGARFEAWSENLKPELWQEALADQGFELADLLAARDPAEPLPWDHVGPFVERDFLLRELAKAQKAQITPDCRQAGCQGCGACQGASVMSLAAPPPKGVAPQEGQPGAELALAAPTPVEIGPAKNTPVKGQKTRPHPEAGPGHRILLEFAKTGIMTLLGHLEMVEVWKKAFRRSGLPVAASQGFHPQPKLSFLTALPLGLESHSELMVVTLNQPKPAPIVRSLLTLPEGLTIIRAQFLPPGGPRLKVASISYLIESDTDLFIGQPLHPAALLSYTDNKGRERAFLLTDFVLACAPTDPRTLALTLAVRNEGSPKPLAVTRTLYGLGPDLRLKATKTATNLA
jgi:radical SAM family uncharacterized protein/radical SAM-linked protein